MNISDSTGRDDLWKEVAPHLDEALGQLSGDDREMILWRYFEWKTAEQIGKRSGLSAEAVQKRVARALDRLRTVLGRHRLTIPTAALASLLSAQALQSAPLGLAAAAIAVAGSAGAILSTTSTFEIIMASTKVKIGLAALLAASVTTPLVLEHQKTSRLAGELTALRQQGSELDRLRAEVERLTAETELSARQRDKERAEVARLLGELTALKGRETKTASAAKTAAPANSPKQVDTSKAAIGTLVPAEAWRNVGFQIPSATVQTLEWAKVNGDTNVIANALAWPDEPSRAGIEAVFASAPESVRARYGSAEAYILSLFNHSGPSDDRHTLTSFRILEENIAGDEAIVHLEYHYADGWRQALDFDAPSQGKLSTSLEAEGENLPTQATTGK